MTLSLNKRLGIVFIGHKDKETKSIQIGKEEVKLSLFANMILYKQNLKDTSKKLLELINSIKLQDTNVYSCLLHFYTLIMNYQKN